MSEAEASSMAAKTIVVLGFVAVVVGYWVVKAWLQTWRDKRRLDRLINGALTGKWPEL